MLQPSPSLQIQTQQRISLPAPDKHTLKIFQKMYRASTKQSGVFDTNTKLFTPLIYDKLYKLAQSKRHSLHTLCCGLTLYENCRQMVSKEANQDGYISIEHQECISKICLDISKDLNESKQVPEIGKRTGSQQGFNREKLRILQRVEWKINYTTFINICQTFINWLQLQFKKQNLCYNLGGAVLEENELVLESFTFLSGNAWTIALQVIEKVLKHFEMEVKEDLESIMLGKVAKISIGKIKTQSTPKKTLIIGRKSQKQDQNHIALQPIKFNRTVHFQNNLKQSLFFQNTEKNLFASFNKILPAHNEQKVQRGSKPISLFPIHLIKNSKQNQEVLNS